MNLDEIEKLAKAAIPNQGEFLDEPSFVAYLNVANPQAILELIERLRDAESALKYYAQSPTPNMTIDEWTTSCKEWGQEPMTWEPLLDLGTTGRKHFAKYGGEGK